MNHSPGTDIPDKSRDNSTAIDIAIPGGVVRISGITESVIRARISASGTFEPDRSYAIERPLPSCAITTTVGKDIYRVSTPSAGIEIGQSPASLSLYGPDNTLLSRGTGISFGPKSVTETRVAVDGEDIYGLGERMTPLGRRGYRVVNWNTDNYRHHFECDTTTYSSFPFMISANRHTGACWGYFLDSPYRSEFSLGDMHWDKMSIELFHHEFNVYFITGSCVGDCVEHYTELTGRHRLPPLWALGYHQCRWSYMSTDEVREIADTYRNKDIPCDALWYDIDYMDKYRVFTFNKDRFGDMVSHTGYLDSRDFKRVAIVDPGVKVDPKGCYDVCDDGVDNGFFIKDASGKIHSGAVWPGETYFPDFSHPDVRAWWGALHRRYYDQGINGFWNDMNEPADKNSRQDSAPHELVCDDDGHGATMGKIHNVYALLEAKATILDGALKLRPNERPFLLTRAGYAGIQKYSAKWGGDNWSTWAHLKASIAQTINMGLSGIGFFGADVGGFSGNASPELLARWTQLGAFYPFFRNHSAIGTISQEPWRFGNEIETVCREAIRLRYRLIPYFYQLFHEMYARGYPVIRPLFWHYGNDPRAYAVCDQFMVGRYLLVAPIVERDARSRLVYLPEGEWFHYLTGELLQGGREHVVEAPLDGIPVFARAGSVIPVMPPVHSTNAIDRTLLTLEVYPGNAGFNEFLYEDDMRTNAYLDNEFTLNEIRCDSRALTVTLGETSAIKTVVVRISKETHGFDERVFEGIRTIECVF